MVKIHNKLRIIKMLLENKTKEFTIREIAKTTKIDYKTTYMITQELISEKTIKAKKAGQTTLCRIERSQFNPYIYNAEYLRVQEILKNNNLNVMHRRIADTKEHFFILLLFGSYAKKKQTKGSDIDLMLITDNSKTKNKIRSALSLMPLTTHLNTFTTEEFLSMLKTTEFNVGREADENNIILFGIEDYYGLIKNAG
ncbi:MAG: nucleotidyltransferase domain-containing protein [Nanoarchaeota archaeon]|nr:nucleotidyltransferase domain-containing protein [Nanoarchaeota archaeon]MCG2718086.1 nucleotidyltransferase domain-containing protein [Nanoarchaeota archaeon]